MNVAHNIQMSMIPKTFPAFPDRKDLELYASLTPAKAVGGDLYDFFIHDNKLYFCIGDVSGKGVPALAAVDTFSSSTYCFNDCCMEPNELRK